MFDTVSNSSKNHHKSKKWPFSLDWRQAAVGFVPAWPQFRWHSLCWTSPNVLHKLSLERIALKTPKNNDFSLSRLECQIFSEFTFYQDCFLRFCNFMFWFLRSFAASFDCLLRNFLMRQFVCQQKAKCHFKIMARFLHTCFSVWSKSIKFILRNLVLKPKCHQNSKQT